VPSSRTKKEVTKEEMEQFLQQNPGLRFDGMRYTLPIEMRGGTWNKPVAAIVEGKYFLLHD
jgi:hypothetical protein